MLAQGKPKTSRLLPEFKSFPSVIPIFFHTHSLWEGECSLDAHQEPVFLVAHIKQSRRDRWKKAVCQNTDV